MTIKSMPAGNLKKYFESKRDSKGIERQRMPDGGDPTRWISGTPEAAEKWLEQIAPPHVRRDRKRRWVGHCRKHLTHLIVGFAEGYPQVRPYLPLVIRTTERLLAAGLPLDRQTVFWCEHPLLQHSHVHGGLVRALLPDGGAYDPKLDRELVVECSWLVSRRLGLSNPLDTLAARMIRGCEFSYRPENRAQIGRICQAVQERFWNNRLATHEKFLQLLNGSKLGQVLVSPGPDGRAQLRTDRQIERLYNYSVAVEGRGDSVIWLAGRICRHNFQADRMRAELNDRARQFNPGRAREVYLRFLKNLNQRISQQFRGRGRGGRPKELRPEIRASFEWLNPDRDEQRWVALESLALSAQPGDRMSELVGLPEPGFARSEFQTPSLSSIPEAAYPFYSDVDDLPRDLTGPHPQLADELDEPHESVEGWLTFNVDSPLPPPVTNLSPSEPEATTSSEPVNPRPAESAGPDAAHIPVGMETVSTPEDSSPSEPTKPEVNEPTLNRAGPGYAAAEDLQREQLRKQQAALAQARLEAFQNHQRQLGISISLSMAMERELQVAGEMAKSRRAANQAHRERMAEEGIRLVAEAEARKGVRQGPLPPPEKSGAPAIPSSEKPPPRSN